MRAICRKLCCVIACGYGNKRLEGLATGSGPTTVVERDEDVSEPSTWRGACDLGCVVVPEMVPWMLPGAWKPPDRACPALPRLALS